MEITLGEMANDEVGLFLNYLNNEEGLLEYKEKAFEAYKEIIARNERSIELIEDVIESYVIVEGNRPSNSFLRGR